MLLGLGFRDDSELDKQSLPEGCDFHHPVPSFPGIVFADHNNVVKKNA